MDHVQLRLLTSGCGCWRLPARSTVASPAVLFFRRTAQKSEEPRACLPSASHRQVLARGRGAGRECTGGCRLGRRCMPPRGASPQQKQAVKLGRGGARVLGEADHAAAM